MRPGYITWMPYGLIFSCFGSNLHRCRATRKWMGITCKGEQNCPWYILYGRVYMSLWYMNLQIEFDNWTYSCSSLLVRSLHQKTEAVTPLDMCHFEYFLGGCFCLRYLLSDESWRIALMQKPMEMDFCIVFCGTVASVDAQNPCNFLVSLNSWWRAFAQNIEVLLHVVDRSLIIHSLCYSNIPYPVFLLKSLSVYPVHQ
jgi:hypothetical protein